MLSQRTKRIWLLLALVLGGVAIGYGELPSRISEKTASWLAADDVNPANKVVKVRKESTPAVLRGSGKLQPVSEVDVASRVPGRVIEVRPRVGDRVTKGQVLAIIRPDELLQRKKSVEVILEAAKADLVQKEIQLAVAEKELERARELLKKDLIAGRDVKEAEVATDAARAQQALAQAQVAEQQAALEQTQYLLGLSKLAAPISGVVIRRLVEPGVYVSASTPVLAVASLDPLKVMINISEEGLDSIRDGGAAQIRADAFPGRIFEGRVAVLHPKPETTQTVVAEIELSNHAHVLAPGMSVEVTLNESNQ
jgi:membrane fusion protein (multidrug efflux system)